MGEAPNTENARIRSDRDHRRDTETINYSTGVQEGVTSYSFFGFTVIKSNGVLQFPGVRQVQHAVLETAG